MEGHDNYLDSVETTAQLTNLILAAEPQLKIDEGKQKVTKAAIKKRREERLRIKADKIKAQLSNEQQKAMELAQEKSGSCLITTMPHARQPIKTLAVAHPKQISKVSSSCACGAAFSLDRSQICKR